MAIAKVASGEWTAATSSGTSTTHAVTVTQAVATGTHLVVLCESGAGALTLNSVSDTKGNTWTVHKSYSRSGGIASVAMASCKVTVALANADVVTVTWSGTAGGRITKVVNYSGMHATTHFNVAGNGGDTVTSTTHVVPGLTASTEGELLLIAWANESNIPLSSMGSSGFTNETGLNSTTTTRYLDWASKIKTASGLESDATLTSSSGSASHFMAAFIPAAVAPTKNTDPSIAPDPVSVGGVLTCTPGTYSGLPVPTITRQWKRDGVNIGGETATTYTTVADDLGTAITCVETATNTAGNTTGTSNAVTVGAASAGGRAIRLGSRRGIGLHGSLRVGR